MKHLALVFILFATQSWANGLEKNVKFEITQDQEYLGELNNIYKSLLKEKSKIIKNNNIEELEELNLNLNSVREEIKSVKAYIETDSITSSLFTLPQRKSSSEFDNDPYNSSLCSGRASINHTTDAYRNNKTGKGDTQAYLNDRFFFSSIHHLDITAYSLSSLNDQIIGIDSANVNTNITTIPTAITENTFEEQNYNTVLNNGILDDCKFTSFIHTVITGPQCNYGMERVTVKASVDFRC